MIGILTVLSISFQEHSIMSFHFIQIFYVSLKFLFIWVLQLYKLSPMCFILYCNWIDLSSNAKKKKKRKNFFDYHDFGRR